VTVRRSPGEDIDRQADGRRAANVQNRKGGCFSSTVRRRRRNETGIGKVDDGRGAVGRRLFLTESADDERHRSILSSQSVVKGI